MPGSQVRIYECRIQAVRSGERVVDAKSTRGRTFKDLSYLLPYINALGSGLDLVPSVGDNCLVLASDRGFAAVVGFRLTLAEGKGSGERGARLDPLPEGSMAMRVVSEDGSEAKVICYRGGTVVVGSGSLVASVYSPLGEARHLFDSWTQEGPGGHIRWSRTPGTDKVSYHAEYRTHCDPKTAGMRVAVDIDETGAVPVSVSVTREKDDPRPSFQIQVAADGSVELKANVLRMNVFATLDINVPNFIVNGRRMLPTKEPY